MTSTRVFPVNLPNLNGKKKYKLGHVNGKQMGVVFLTTCWDVYYVYHYEEIKMILKFI